MCREGKPGDEATPALSLNIWRFGTYMLLHAVAQVQHQLYVLDTEEYDKYVHVAALKASIKNVFLVHIIIYTLTTKTNFF